MNYRTFAVVALAAVVAFGCSKSDTPTTQAENSAAPAAQPSKVAESQGLPVSADAKPESVVSAFLDALRRGDKDHTALLLTDKARAETQSKGLVVSPESVPHASYKVAQADALPDNPNGAHVSSVWTEKFEDGTEEEYEIVWVLRKQKDGWRIAGMATQLVPGQEALYLNFEDPEDMLRKKEEAVKQAQAGSGLAAEPAAPSPAVNGAALPGSTEPAATTASPEFPTNKLRR
jgi:hypothetical protein